MPKPISAAIYARISSDQDGTRLGVTRQVSECQERADANGWQVVDTFIDNDISAYSGKRRPEYERMLDSMREGRVNAVIVYHLDRLTRRPKELEEFVEICDRAGIKNLTTVQGDVNIGTGDGLLIARIQAAVAANESASKSRRVRSKMRQVAESGMPHGGSNRPFGYEADAITINRREARIIKACAERFIAGESLRSIAAWMNEQAIPTVTGGGWTTTTLKQMLTNPRLIGLRTHNGEVVGRAAWKPILTQAQHDQILNMVARRAQSGRRAPRRYLLSGMCRCGKCGNRLFSAARKTSRRYVCLSGPDHGGCGSLTVVAEPVEILIADMVLYRLDTPDLAALMTRGDESPEAERIREELAADVAQRDELAAQYANRAISASEWMVARNIIDDRIRRSEATLASQVNASALSALVGTGAELRAAWSTLTLNRQAAIIKTVVDHVEILPGKIGATRLDPDRVRPVWLY